MVTSYDDDSSFYMIFLEVFFFMEGLTVFGRGEEGKIYFLDFFVLLLVCFFVCLRLSLGKEDMNWTFVYMGENK